MRIALVLLALYILRRVLKGFVEEELPHDEELPELAMAEHELSPEEQRRQEVAEEVGKISQEEPEAVAALLRTWLMEDQA
jgi:flagellar biosynthesis/type III secretory pathway M-ring protein FliF/YscJ